jgi:hypothetical protein
MLSLLFVTGSPKMIVHLRFEDFRQSLFNTTTAHNKYSSPFTTSSSSSGAIHPHVVLGCCFVDLFEPLQLVKYLHVITGESGALLYFPITFKGQTDVVTNDTAAATHSTVVSAYLSFVIHISSLF